MIGKIVSVNISRDKGEKKHNIGQCMLIQDKGLQDDAHAGFMHRQVSLLATESIAKIKVKGIDVGYGDFAENLTTEGIELFTLPVGTRLKVGEDIILRVTQIGKECHARCAIFQQVGDCVMPREGIFTEVLAEGEVKIGDGIEVI
ncbi:MAG: MOSC domain protein [Syntrophorhabdus sp. PtaU1.Bin058]|nr:MAG: MOSC domain protein [Syntrophorhabdus sp. PtaU1.Bin058]